MSKRPDGPSGTLPAMVEGPSLGSPTLVLFPTELERARFLDLGGLEPGFAVVKSCGFGPVAAAARSAELLSRLRPARVLLVGIAGAFETERHPIGHALTFGSVALDGIGVGRGASFQAATELGFPHEPLYASLPLARPVPPGSTEPGLLLTVCAASGSSADALARRERFPAAVAEDMEGFAVALACAQSGVPLAIVRGISNRVGERDPRGWRVPAALSAARRLATEVLACPLWSKVST